MSKMQRTKGQVFERLIATILRDIWPDARRGIGQARSAKEVPDVDGTPYWPELKHKRNVSIGAAMKQARRDTDGRPPIVISRENRGPILVTMEIEVFLRLAKDSHDLRSVCVTAGHAAELDAADKALREAAERLEPVGGEDLGGWSRVDEDMCQVGSDSPAYLDRILSLPVDQAETAKLRAIIQQQMKKTGTGE